jgi:hypothetical protein
MKHSTPQPPYQFMLSSTPQAVARCYSRQETNWLWDVSVVSKCRNRHASFCSPDAATTVRNGTMSCKIFMLSINFGWRGESLLTVVCFFVGCVSLCVSIENCFMRGGMKPAMTTRRRTHKCEALRDGFYCPIDRFSTLPNVTHNWRYSVSAK